MFLRGPFQLVNLEMSFQVYCRVRPSEEEVSCVECTSTSIVVEQPQGSRKFEFDHVFDSRQTQKDVAAEFKPVIEQFLGGYNVAIIAYGQSGSGKTYTIGTSKTSGLVTALCSEMFPMQLQLTCVEVLNNQLRDVLNKSRNVELKETSPTPFVPPLTECYVSCQEELETLLNTIAVSRRSGSTKLNSQSSRSHVVFTLRMNLGSQLVFVDLAGSERISKSGASGNLLAEGIAINKALTSLGHVLGRLANGQQASYRDSKLTRLLQPVLSGDFCAYLILCISEDPKHSSETVNTLQFGRTARGVPVAPKRMELREYNKLYESPTPAGRISRLASTPMSCTSPPSTLSSSPGAIISAKESTGYALLQDGGVTVRDTFASKGVVQYSPYVTVQEQLDELETRLRLKVHRAIRCDIQKAVRQVLDKDVGHLHDLIKEMDYKLHTIPRTDKHPSRLTTITVLSSIAIGIVIGTCVLQYTHASS